MNDISKPRRPRAGTILACVALFAALGGSAFAAKAVISGKDIKKNTVTSKNIKDKTLKVKDMSKQTVAQFKNQPLDPESVSNAASLNITANTTVEILDLAVPSGSYMVFAKTNLFSSGTDQVDCTLQANGDEIDVIRWNPPANNKRTPVSFQAIAPGGTTDLSVECATGTVTGSAFDRSLIAVPID